MNTFNEYGSQGNQGIEHREGPVARNIERQTAKLPSDIFLWAAGAAILGSLAFQVVGTVKGSSSSRSTTRAPMASFIGMWVPSLLLLGVYNKIVKVAGSDKFSR